MEIVNKLFLSLLQEAQLHTLLMAQYLCMWHNMGLIVQARMQPFSKGGSIGGVSQTMSAFMLWALSHTPPIGGSEGMLSQKFLEI